MTKTLLSYAAIMIIVGTSIPPSTSAQIKPRLIKCPNDATVYLVDGFQRAKRFLDEQTFYSHSFEFSQIETIQCSPSLPYLTDGNVSNRNGYGFRLMKRVNDPRVYQCGANQVCTHVKNEQDATRLFGSMWTRQIYETTEAILEQAHATPVISTEIPTTTSFKKSEPFSIVEGTHTGRVTDAQTGGPVIGATIVHAYSNIFTTTDKDGYFELPYMTGENYVVVDWYKLSQTKSFADHDHNNFVIEPLDPGSGIKLVHPKIQWNKKITGPFSSISGTIINKKTGKPVPVKLVFENRSEPEGKIVYGDFQVNLRTGVYRTYLITTDAKLQAQLPNERYLFSVPEGYEGTMILEIELK